MTQGVNAATDTDNTTYTVESASAEGMLEIIPVYLDHILFPYVHFRSSRDRQTDADSGYSD